MIPYIAITVIPIIAWLIHDKVSLAVGDRIFHQTKSLSLDCFMLIFLLLLAFRGVACGNDTIQYRRLFEEYSAKDVLELFEDHTHEWGYRFLNKFLGSLTNSYQVLLFITSLLCVCPLWYFYKRESEMPLLTISLFLSVAQFVMFFSGIRQSIAMSMGVLAWYSAKNKKIGHFALSVLVAIQFHTSAFMLSLLYPMYHAKITKKWLWFAIPCMVAVYIFKDAIFSFLITFLWKDYDAAQETGAYMILFLLILFAIFSYVVVDDETLDQDTVALRNMLLLSVVLQIFAMLHPLAMRMNYYFLIFIPVLMPKIVNRCKKQYANVGKIAAVVMTVYFYYYFINMMITDNDPLNIFPYIPFWQNV